MRCQTHTFTLLGQTLIVLASGVFLLMYLELNSIAIALESRTQSVLSAQVTARIIVALAMSKCLQYLQHVHLRGFISSPPNNSYGFVPVFMSYLSCVSVISRSIVIRRPAERAVFLPYVIKCRYLPYAPLVYLHPLMWNAFWHVACRRPALYFRDRVCCVGEKEKGKGGNEYRRMCACVCASVS